MAVLYLDHPEADFLAAQVFVGLCRLLGPAHVIDYPYKASYHGEVHRYPSPYTSDPGTTPWSSWDSGDGLTAPFEWMEAQPGKRHTYEEIGGLLLAKHFDLVLLASPRKYNTMALESLLASVGRHRMPPIVLIDGEDYTTIRWDLIEQFQPKVYFKRELVRDPFEVYHDAKARMLGKVRIEPLPLAPVRTAAKTVTDTDVVLLGGSNCPGGKAPYEDAVRRVTSSHLLGHVSFDQFLASVSRARIAVALRGHSQDSLRSWEMLACDGPMVAVYRHTLLRPNPFHNGLHVAEFGSPAELEAVLRTYLADEPRRAAVAAAGHAHLLAHHTPEARARYLLDKVLP